MDLDRRCFTESVKIPKAHSLSTCIDVAGCGYPIKFKACRSITTSYAFQNTVTISALVAEAITFLMIVLNIYTAPVIGGIGSSLSPC